MEHWWNICGRERAGRALADLSDLDADLLAQGYYVRMSDPWYRFARCAGPALRVIDRREKAVDQIWVSGFNLILIHYKYC